MASDLIDELTVYQTSDMGLPGPTIKAQVGLHDLLVALGEDSSPSLPSGPIPTSSKPAKLCGFEFA